MNVNKITSTVRQIGPRALRSASATLLGLSMVVGGVGVAQAEDIAAACEASESKATPSGLAAKKLLLDVAKANGRLVAVGEFGHIVYSDDDGGTWTQANCVATQVTLTSVYFPSKEVGYAVGHDAVILKTEDGGENWAQIYEDFDAETPLMNVIFNTPSYGLAMGAFGFVLETTDGGASWAQRPIVEGGEDDFHLNDSFRAKDGSLWVAAEFGTVYRSGDEGVTFERLQTPYEGSFWGGMGLSDGAVLIYGMRGNVFRTVDNGATWTKIETGVTKSFGGSVELANGTVVLAGLNGAVAYSDDLGKSFTTISRADREGYNAVIGSSGDQIAIFGESGVKIMPNTAEAALAAGGSSS